MIIKLLQNAQTESMGTDVRMNADTVSMEYNAIMKKERVYMDVIQDSNKKTVKNVSTIYIKTKCLYFVIKYTF